jgi:hypothetical protein
MPEKPSVERVAAKIRLRAGSTAIPMMSRKSVCDPPILRSGSTSPFAVRS